MRLSDTPRFSIGVLVTLLIVAAPLMLPRPAAADPLGQMTDYYMYPAYNKLGSIITGPDGNLWFLSKGTYASDPKKIVKMSTTGMIIASYTIPAGYSSINHLTLGPNGEVWFGSVITGTLNVAIGKMTQLGVFTFYQLPSPGDHHTTPYVQSIEGIAFKDGQLWISRYYTRYLQKLYPNGTIKTIEISTPTTTPSSPLNRYKLKGGIALNVRTNCMTVSTENEARGISYIESFCENGRTVIEVPDNPAGFSQSGRDFVYDDQGGLWASSNAREYLNYMDTSGNFQFIPYGVIDLQITDGVLGPDNAVWFTAKHRALSKEVNMVLRVDPVTKSITQYPLPINKKGNSNWITVGPDGNLWFTETDENRVVKIGVGSIAVDDRDNDGLTYAQELQQGTSDLSKDTDKDGLSDYTESQWNTTRDDIFCHPITNYCEYPDPLQQDIYIETDWMHRPNDGPIVNYSMQPSEYSVDMIKAAFTNQGMKAHIDTGQLGGGNEVPYERYVYFQKHETGTIDYWDYRDGDDGIAQNFATNRKDIYRYMLMGHGLADHGLNDDGDPYDLRGVSGISYPGTEDMFISYGLIKENPGWYSLLDIAVAGTMHHELGHSLCLTDAPVASYVTQQPACVFAAIDTNGTSDYPSAMNYMYQGVLVDYSDGTNSSNDHDDWGAITPRDFVFRDSLETSSGATISQLKEAAKIRKDKGIKVERKNGKFEVTQTQKGITKRLN